MLHVFQVILAGWRVESRCGAALMFALAILVVPTSVRASEHRILVFGDSLAAAYGIAPQEGWVSLLENALKDKATVVNASVSGETTRGGIGRLKRDLIQHKPTHVLLELGANDGLRGLPISETEKNLKAMIDAIKRAKAQPILIGMQIPPNYGLDYAVQFRDLFPRLAKQNKAALVPFLLDGVADDFSLFQADRLHPTAAAQPRILRNVLPVVEAMLRTSPSRSSRNKG